MRIAIIGTHGAGKSTLCYRLVGELRRRGINAAIARETARDSQYLLHGRIVPAMEVEIFGLQLAEEMRSSLLADVVLCDRAVIDTVAYHAARFHGDGDATIDAYYSAMNAFMALYVPTYDSIYYLSDGENYIIGDAFRDADTITVEAARLALDRLIENWTIPVVRVGREEAYKMIIERIERYFELISQEET